MVSHLFCDDSTQACPRGPLTGFGICSIEAMACELPVILTDYTTTKELVTDHNAGIAVPICTDITGTFNVERGIMDIPKAVEALEIMYEDWKNGGKKLEEWGKNGRNAVIKDYNWDKIVEDWKKLFKEMVQ